MTMGLDADKLRRVQEMGGRVTSVQDWLGLSDEEVVLLDMKIQLGRELEALRRRKKLTQAEVAELLQTSQGRVSRLERGQASLDQLAWSLLVMGESRERIARVISG